MASGGWDITPNHSPDVTPLAVALVAEEAAGVKALQLLADRGHQLIAVFAQSASAGAAGSVAGRAKLLGVPLLDAETMRDRATAEWLQERNAQLLLNVHSLHIIEPSILDVPALGAYNLHPGPLPERAGLHTPSWALYEGADSHGVTLHRMTAQVDAGSIAFDDTFAIAAADTGLSVMMQCVRRGIRLLELLLEHAERGKPIPAHDQDLGRRRWYSAGPPEGGRLDWDRPASRVVDFVRACDYRPFRSPWGFPRCTADGVDIGIRTARALGPTNGAVPGTVAHTEGGAILVAAGDVWVRVDTVEVTGQAVQATDAVRDGVRLHR